MLKSYSICYHAVVRRRPNNVVSEPLDISFYFTQNMFMLSTETRIGTHINWELRLEISKCSA